MTIDEIIAVLEAAKQKKAIQYRVKDNDNSRWIDNPHPGWNFEQCEYRVKPAEPRRFFLNLYPYNRPPCAHPSREEADNGAVSDRTECIEVQEVL